MPVGGGKSSKEVEAGGAFVRLFAKDRDLQMGLRKAQAMLRAFNAYSQRIGGSMFGWGSGHAASAIAASARRMGAAIRTSLTTGLVGGGAMTAAMGKALFGSIDRAKELERYSNKLGESTDRLSAFAYAAETTGMSFEELADNFENWPERLSEASAGTGEAAEAFKKLGLQKADLERMKELPITEQMISLADAMQGVTNETDRLMLLGKFFSDKGQFFNELFKLGSGGIRARMSQAADVGASMDPARTRELADAGRQLQVVWTAAKSAFLQVGGALLPTAEQIKVMTDRVLSGVKSWREWVAENKGVVRIAAIAAAGLAAVSGAALMLGPVVGAVLIPAQFAIGGLAAAGGVLATAMGAAASATATAMGVIGSAVAGVVSGVLAMGGRILASGITKGLAAIGSRLTFLAWPLRILGVVGLSASGALDAVFDVASSVGRVLSSLGEAVKRTAGAFGDFGRGVGSAFSTAFSGFKERVTRAMSNVTSVVMASWDGIVSAVGRGDLAEAGGIAFDGLKLAWLKIKPELEAVWVGLKHGLGKAWEELVANMKDIWAGVDAAIQQTMSKVREILAEMAPYLELVDRHTQVSRTPGEEEESNWWLTRQSGRAGGWVSRRSWMYPDANKTGQVSPSFAYHDKELREEAARLQREAIDRGMTKAQADIISRGIIARSANPYRQDDPTYKGTRALTPAEDAAHKAAMEDLERRRAANIKVAEEVKRTQEAIEAFGRVIADARAKAADITATWKTTGDRLTDIWSRIVKNAIDIHAAEKRLLDRLKEEQRKAGFGTGIGGVLGGLGVAGAPTTPENAKGAVLGGLGFINAAGAAVQPVAGKTIPDIMALSRQVNEARGIFDSMGADMQLGLSSKLADKSVEKATLAAAKETAKGVNEMKGTLIDIRNNTNQWGRAT